MHARQRRAYPGLHPSVNLNVRVSHSTLVRHIEASVSTQLKQLQHIDLHLKVGSSIASASKFFVNRLAHAQPGVISRGPRRHSSHGEYRHEVSLLSSRAECEVRTGCCFLSFLCHKPHWLLL